MKEEITKKSINKRLKTINWGITYLENRIFNFTHFGDDNYPEDVKIQIEKIDKGVVKRLRKEAFALYVDLYSKLPE